MALVNNPRTEHFQIDRIDEDSTEIAYASAEVEAKCAVRVQIPQRSDREIAEPPAVSTTDGIEDGRRRVPEWSPADRRVQARASTAPSAS